MFLVKCSQNLLVIIAFLGSIAENTEVIVTPHIKLLLIAAGHIVVTAVAIMHHPVHIDRIALTELGIVIAGLLVNFSFTNIVAARPSVSFTFARIVVVVVAEYFTTAIIAYMITASFFSFLFNFY